jgi:hypothetical protein
LPQSKRLHRRHFPLAGVTITINIDRAGQLETRRLKKSRKRQKQSCRFNFCDARIACTERRNDMRPPGNGRDIQGTRTRK